MDNKWKITLLCAGSLFVGGLLGSAGEEKPQVKTETVTKEVKVEDTTKIKELESQNKALSEEIEDLKGKAKEEEKKPQNEAPVKPVTLGSGKHTVGEDIPAGKYIVSTQESSGNLFVRDPNDPFTMVNEILGTMKDLAVNNVKVELKKGQEIEISSLNAVLFTPKK